MESDDGAILTIQVHIFDEAETSSIEEDDDWCNLNVARKDLKSGGFDRLVAPMAPEARRVTLNFPVGSGDTRDALAVVAALAKTFYSAEISLCGLLTREFTEKAAWRMLSALPSNVVCVEIKMRKMPEDGVPQAVWVAAPHLQDVHVLCETAKCRTHRCFSRTKW